MLGRGLMVLTLALSLPLSAVAQGDASQREQTLADIRQELSVLFVEMQRLRRELSTTGGPGVSVLGTSIPDRVDSIETELRRLTAKTEELENRIDRIVVDGTNRIGDLEFRLVELEGGDIGQLGETTTLGGGELPVAPMPAPEPAPIPGAELAVGEQADFERAQAAFDAGDYQTAADQFQTFTQTYTGGPLTGAAHFMRGEALARMGLDTAAARAYLESFSGSPSGDLAPAALLQLGLSLDRIGQAEEACVTLGEVTARFPASPASLEAQTARADLGCS